MADQIPRDILKERMSDWYRGVTIELEGGGLDARREAIEGMARGLNVESAPIVVAYAHGRKEFGQQLSSWINENGIEHDPDFTVKSDGLEPRVMVACAIAHRFATFPTNDITSLHALLCQCAAFRGLRTAARGQDLAGLAVRQLTTATDRDKAPPLASEKTIVKTLNASFKELPAAPEQGGAGSGLAEWLTALQGAIETIGARIDTLERSLAANAVTTREELDEVAWLLDGFCELGERSWGQMKEGASVVAGAELAEISAIAPPAQAAVMLRSSLVKAGRDPGAKISMLDAVGRAAPALDVWPVGRGHLLLPISAALDAWREKGRGGSNWRKLAREKRGGGEVPDRSEGVLADQAMRELVIAKALANV